MEIFLDLDGTTVNWLDALGDILQLGEDRQVLLAKAAKSEMVEDIPGFENFVERIQDRGRIFWGNLEPLPWAKDLWDTCIDYGKVYILSNPWIFKDAASCKIEFIQSFFKTKDYILTKHKYLLANPNRVLIDDDKRQINNWISHGGIGYLWPNQFEINPEIEIRKLESFLGDIEENVKIFK